MANHKKAIQQLLIEKGLFIQTPDEMIYIGISRKSFPEWKGWELIDLKLEKLALDGLVANNWKTIGKYLKTSGILNDYIYEYYKEILWDKILGDQIISQEFASIIFNYACKRGVKSIIKLLNQIFNSNSIEQLIPLINNYYLLNSGYKFSIDFLKIVLKRYLKILNRYPKLTIYLIELINESLSQLNKILDVKELSKAIDISTIIQLQQFLENESNSTIENNIDVLKQLINNL